MIPNLEQHMKDTLKHTLPDEVMGGFDKDAEWPKLQQRLHGKSKHALPALWPYAAAAAIIALVCSIALQYLHTNKDAEQAVTVAPNQTNDNSNSQTTVTPIIHDSTNNTTVVHKLSPNKKGRQTIIRGEVITNGTPCPIAIRINQTMKCPDSRPAAITSRSTMEPGQTAKLDYRDQDSIARNCSLTVKEIAITSIATGETIVLNAHSSPSTAQEVFSYMTGQKKGDILAGVFSADCNHSKNKHRVTIGNSNGTLLLQ